MATISFADRFKDKSEHLGKTGMMTVDENKAIKKASIPANKLHHPYVKKLDLSAPRNEISLLRTPNLLLNLQKVHSISSQTLNLTGSLKTHPLRSQNLSSLKFTNKNAKETSKKVMILGSKQINVEKKNDSLTERLPPIKNKLEIVKSVIENFKKLKENLKNHY
ncbi:hypothetical protein SteCoe_22299 [Stentor coeruleus]|uniref:Uncharacterized protein n=1 Tax=Stentor coeruleus TaxID=5963 RepID=A0A1R2BN67_9CILI|nr:hypothetical protein SteCoe_22299 [Stentor coeruleus]